MKSFTLKVIAMLFIFTVSFSPISLFQQSAQAHFDQAACDSATDLCGDWYDIVMNVCYSSEANKPSGIHGMTKCEYAVWIDGN